jgi:hypothetical protein
MATLKENLETLEKRLKIARFENSKTLAEAALDAINVIAEVDDKDTEDVQWAFRTIYHLSMETAAMLRQTDTLHRLLHQTTHHSDDHPAPDNCDIAAEVEHEPRRSLSRD